MSRVANLRFKPVMRWSACERKLRLFRVMWERGIVGDGDGFSVKLAVSCVARLLGFKRGRYDFRITFAGIQIHYRRSYGGRFV